MSSSDLSSHDGSSTHTSNLNNMSNLTTDTNNNNNNPPPTSTSLSSPALRKRNNNNNSNDNDDCNTNNTNNNNHNNINSPGQRPIGVLDPVWGVFRSSQTAQSGRPRARGGGSPLHIVAPGPNQSPAESWRPGICA